MLAGALALLAILGGVLALHALLPARRVEGYATDGDGRPLRYRLNGPLVFAVVVGAWVAVGASGALPWDWLYAHRAGTLAAAVAAGLAFTAALVAGAPPTGKSLAADLYLGRRENPQALGGRVDAKMFLYLFGAVMLELNVLAFAAHHVVAHPGAWSPGVLLHAGLFSFFLVEYLLFERVHLYTYDFVAERVGFKLGWGCLAFYPFFYNVGLWFVADAPPARAHPAWFAVAAATFFGGWVLSRGANLQKFAFKTRPERAWFGPLAQRALTDGNGRRVLVSGFWGIARHVNYLGELLMASGLALALGPRALAPWLYPLYYVALLVPRQRDDDRRCAAQYGALWQEYVRAVPWRIVPWIY